MRCKEVSLAHSSSCVIQGVLESMKVELLSHRKRELEDNPLKFSERLEKLKTVQISVFVIFNPE